MPDALARPAAATVGIHREHGLHDIGIGPVVRRHLRGDHGGDVAAAVEQGGGGGQHLGLHEGHVALQIDHRVEAALGVEFGQGGENTVGP